MRKRIISRFSSSIQATYRFSVEPSVPGADVSGIVEVKGSNWIFPKPAVQQALARDNSVDKGMWDTFYSVTVIPDCDIRINLEGSSSSKIWLYIAIALLIIATASSLLFRIF